jgi:hypothetical protein
MAFGELDKTATHTDAPVFRVGREHPELGRRIGERLDPDDADDLPVRLGDRDLPRLDELGDRRRPGTWSAFAPQPVLRIRVDVIHEPCQLPDESVVPGGRGIKEPNHASMVALSIQRCNT